MNIHVFKEKTFFNALKSFFQELNVPISEVTEDPANPEDIVSTWFNKANEAHSLIDTVYFLGMVNESAFEGEENTDSLRSIKASKEDYDGLLIFGVQLKNRANSLNPTRSQLAEITRLFNREYNYTPVTLIFKYGEQIALANSERLKYKQEWREGERVGKVSLLRDIHIMKPHRGHLDIINQLKIPTSGAKQVDSFTKLYAYWQSVFNVSILNKKFYQELQNWYFWAIKEVSFPNEPKILDEKIDGDEAKLQEAIKAHKGKNVIRLLTRILFIWFIKEKKLIPEEIFDEATIADKLIDDFTPQKPQGIFATGKHNSKYYRAILQNLFFATLNQEMGKRDFRNDKQHQNVTNLMRYKSYFKNPDYFVQLMEDVVPFMNGGLFECLDKPHPDKKGKQGGDLIIYSDGFSDRADNLLEVPDYLFFDVDENVDLSDDFGSKAKVYENAKTRGLLEILKSYKFTITENTPIEEDVALDPELLGKVFENLLASYNPETKTTARKQTGSFYTPREIVNYMVDESLIAYLKSAVNFQFTEITNSAVNSQFTEITKSAMNSQFTDLTNQDTLYPFFNPNNEIIIKQGNLPHWTNENVWYFITFRLADSIPFEKQEQLKHEREIWLKNHKKEGKGNYSKEELKEYYRLFSDRVEGWLNNGYGSCVLQDEKNAKIVGDALKHFEGDRYNLDEWVVMPNHVHVLVKPIADNKLSDILHSWKSFTANEINKNIGKTGQLWMHESYDHIVRNEDAFEAIRNYIRKNPVKAGIAQEIGSFLLSKQAAEDSLTPTQEALDTMLHQLFSFNETNPFKDYADIQKQIIKALDNAKILDPAAGSGAFPMGVLQKMVHVLHKIDPNNIEWKQRQIDKVNNAIESLETLDDAKFREQSIKELKSQIKDIEDAFENNELDYGRKLFLIENCIYGVDIQSIATQISKLRFFISLIVDQKIDKDKDNFGIRPLPNLETKFVTANTLIGIDKPDAQLSMFDNTEVKKLEAQLKKVRHKIFSSKSPKRKRELREEDKKLREQIAELLEEGGMENKTARQLASWDPYDQNASSPFFDPEWMFDISDGLDVILGNPPYISYYSGQATYISKEDYNFYLSHYDFIENKKSKNRLGTVMMFLEKTHKFLSSEGVFTFIIDLNIFSDAYIPIRKFLHNKIAIHELINNLSEFENVGSGQIIIQGSNDFKKENKMMIYSDFSKNERQVIPQSRVNSSNNFSLKFSKYELILNEIENQSARFEDSANIISGMNIGGVKNYFLSDTKVDSSYHQAILSGNIFKYRIEYPNEVQKRNSRNNYIKFDKSLEKYIWDNKLGTPSIGADDNKFKEPKILLRRPLTSDGSLAAALSNNSDQYSDVTVYIINKLKIDLHYLLAIINSSMATFYCRQTGIIRADKGQQPQITINKFKEFPIRHEASFDYCIQVISQILSQIKKDISPYYEVLDGLVFNLYFPDHMKEREIDVLSFVERDINAVMQNRDFEKLSDAEKEKVIAQLHQTWSDPENEVVKRMSLFKEKSPDILKPILES